MNLNFDIVVPLYQCRWITRSVIEGLVSHYNPRKIHIITLFDQVDIVLRLSDKWNLSETLLEAHDEDHFFEGFSKKTLLENIASEHGLYQPGWFYQQLLKLGAAEGIADLKPPYLVWDSDLLPLEKWPVYADNKPMFALLQHKSGGNPEIVAKWQRWTETLLNVPWLTDDIGTFVPHHMWFDEPFLSEFKKRIKNAFPRANSWQEAMLSSIAAYETFSEYWAYASLVAVIEPDALNYYPYSDYGETTERFFDDGNQLFGSTLQKHLARQCDTPETAVSYEAIKSFIDSVYEPEKLPSSIAFEANPRHIKKDKSTMHIEETRSRWNLRA